MNIFNQLKKKKIKHVEVHDASPRYLRELRKIFNKLESMGVKEDLIAIVPNWAGQWDIRKHPDFIKLIKERERRGAELVLHGYTHKTDKKPHLYDFLLGNVDAFEFRDLKYEEARLKLRNAKQTFKAAFGHYPKGFIAPNWSINEEAIRAVKDEGFEYISSIRHIKFFNKPWVKSRVISFDFGNNKIFNIFLDILRFLSFFIKFDRVAIHPSDIKEK
jgi:predicted deacetylase